MSRNGAGGRPAGPGAAAPGWLRTNGHRIAWLTVVWVLLWGSFTALTVVGGVVVAVIVTFVVRLPVVPDILTVRPVALLALVLHLAYDLVVSSVETSFQTLRHGRDTRACIVAVPLLTESDRVATVVANALSLSPGTMVLRVDQRNRTWFVYALGPRTRADAERVRRSALLMQRRVIAALGSAEELAAADRAGTEVAR